MKKVIFFFTLITLFAFVSGAMAAGEKTAPAKSATTPSPAPKLGKFSGVVDKVDEMAKTILVKGKVKKEEKIITFALDDKTKITKAGKDVPLAELKKDTSVAIEYNRVGDKLIAVTIKVAAPKAATKAAPKKEEPKK